MSSSYRWNTSDFATGYDAAAAVVHPHYVELQNVILDALHEQLTQGGLVVDLGGGSGKLVERILDANPAATAIVVDQSEPFLAIAERRLERFGPRAQCQLTQLQGDWGQQLPGPAAAIVSMSAIHHLEPADKKALYARCYEALTPHGVLLNGDEVRPLDDEPYLATLSRWADHMHQQMAAGNIPASFHEALHGWIDRNVTRFGAPKKTGDDCHETSDAQLAYFRAAGFQTADVPWQRELWALLRGIK